MPAQTVTLSQARALLAALAPHQAVLLLSPPGLGKSELVSQVAADAGLECRSLLGTQIASEDVSGVPRIVRNRTVFAPPRVLLPVRSKPFVLFLDELPACNPDVQKAFYSLILERRVGEYPLPRGTWVVAAGNEAHHHAFVRSLSSALVNRFTILYLRENVREWLRWATRWSIRAEILAFIAFSPASLLRKPPAEPVPFSTPRSWVMLSRGLDRAERAGALEPETARALAYGCVSAEDAAVFVTALEHGIVDLHPVEDYFANPENLPSGDYSATWYAVQQIRVAVREGVVRVPPAKANSLLRALPIDLRLAVLLDLVEEWAALGAEPAMLHTLREVLAA